MDKISTAIRCLDVRLRPLSSNKLLLTEYFRDKYKYSSSENDKAQFDHFPHNWSYNGMQIMTLIEGVKQLS